MGEGGRERERKKKKERERERERERRAKRATVLFGYEALDSSELTIFEGQELTVVTEVDSGWWKCKADNGNEGLIPGNYVKLQ